MRSWQARQGGPGGGRLRRLARGLLPDRNPLRRAVDRVEAVLLGLLVAGFLAGAPLAAVTAGTWASASSRAMLRVEPAWRQVRAVLLQGTPARAHAMFQAPGTVMARARWTAPDGTVRAGEVYAPASARAGRAVTIWTDRHGRIMPFPVHYSDVVVQALAGGALAVLALAAVLWACWLVIRRVLDRWRLAAWDLGWAVTGPQWTRRH
jgi:hypothetical protein